MAGTIEIKKIETDGNTIRYEIQDNTTLNLLKQNKVNAWVKYHHAEVFPFRLKELPESILSIPITLYLMPITWFYGVELIVPSLDKVLYDDLPDIYETYSGIYGPFKSEWRGNVKVINVVENQIIDSHFGNIVFFSGGVDALHAGVNHAGNDTILVSVPSIEDMVKKKGEHTGDDFIKVKSRLIREFSAVSGSEWLLVTNNFQNAIFNDIRIKEELKDSFGLNSEAFCFDGWFGIKYLGNLLSSAPFAYALGIKQLIMGSGFEQLEDKYATNYDGANPELSDSFKFAGTSFSEQDGLHVRRSQKVKHIVEWCKSHGKKTMFWACFHDEEEQCGICAKCVRTQLNILCAGENPAEWGYMNFDENRFSTFVQHFQYKERNPCWLWDIIDSIEESQTYPYCNQLLHWLKRIGYKQYAKKARFAFWGYKLLDIKKYPHYVKVLFRIICKRK